VLKATKVDAVEWTQDLIGQGEWFDSLGPTVPKLLRLQHELLLKLLKQAPAIGARRDLTADDLAPRTPRVRTLQAVCEARQRHQSMRSRQGSLMLRRARPEIEVP
jgi:hypothetical protein